MKRFVCLLLAVSLLLCGCAPKVEQVHFFAMDAPMKVIAYGGEAKSACEKVQQLIFRLDTLADAFDEKSNIAKLNAANGEGVKLDLDVTEQIRIALDVSEKSAGLYDISVHGVYTLWDFTKEMGSAPDENDIKSAMKSVGYENIEIDEDGNARLKNGAQISLASIAKGYASDKAAQLLKVHGVISAMLDLGGNVYALGKRPDGKMWRIGVQDPFNEDEIVLAISVCDKAVVTSGSYRRCFVDAESGVRYHHILNPKTGYPAESELESVTVVCENGAYADALATALFVMGTDKAKELYRENGDFEAVLISKDKKVYVTKGLELAIDSIAEEYTVTYIE